MALVLGTARTASAVILAYEGFNYAPGKVLEDPGPNSGAGWAGSWDNVQGAGPDDSVFQAGSLSYTDGLGNVLTTSGGKLQNTGSAGTSQIGRSLAFRRDGVTLGATAAAPKTTWISFLAIRTGAVNPPTTTPALRAGTYARGAFLALFDSTQAVVPMEEKLDIGENTNFEYPMPLGSGAATHAIDTWMITAPRVSSAITAQASPSYVDPQDGPIMAASEWHRNPVNGRFGTQMTQEPFAGQVSLMVARIDHYGGAAPLDKVFMWIDPDMNAAPSVANADATIDLSEIEARGLDQMAPTIVNSASGNLFSFDRIRLFAGNAQGETPFAQWSLDEVRIGETFSDVTPHIPEPAALSLGLIGLAALSIQRRRR
jgi:hypothetical protein